MLICIRPYVVHTEKDAFRLLGILEQLIIQALIVNDRSDFPVVIIRVDEAVIYVHRHIPNIKFTGLTQIKAVENRLHVEQILITAPIRADSAFCSSVSIFTFCVRQSYDLCQYPALSMRRFSSAVYCRGLAMLTTG